MTLLSYPPHNDWKVSMAKKTTSRAAPRPRAAKLEGPTARHTVRTARRSPVISNAERRAVTRRAVLDAAAACFDRTGYLGTRLDDVTSQAKLTKGAVYFHFGSKEALAVAVIDEQAAYWPEVVTDLTSRPGSSLTHLVALTYEVARTLRDNVVVRAGLRLSLDRDVPGSDPIATLAGWTDTIADMLRKARRAGDVSSEIVPVAAARVIVASLFGVYHLAVVVDGKPDARRRLDEFWGLMLPQMGP